MANYANNEKATQLDALTTLASDDVVVVGDTSDSGKAKAITKDNLKVQMESGLVNATATDTTASYLDNKIEITSDDDSVTITKTIQNSGGNEKIIYDLSVESGGSGNGGNGGVKIGQDTTQVVVASNTTVSAYTFPILGNTLGTNNSISYKVVISTVDLDANTTFNIKYGGTTINTITTSGSGASSATIEGTISANGVTNSQKGSMILWLDSNEINQIDNDGTASVDSTSSQDLVLEVVAAVGGGATTESMVVIGIAATTLGAYSNGITTKNMADASTTQTIAHGLSGAPGKVRITSAYADDTGDLNTQSVGSYDGTHNSCIYSYWQGATGTGSNGFGTSTSYTVGLQAATNTDPGTAGQTGVVTVDATNITITWTKHGSPTGTASLMWEAQV